MDKLFLHALILIAVVDGQLARFAAFYANAGRRSYLVE